MPVCLGAAKQGGPGNASGFFSNTTGRGDVMSHFRPTPPQEGINGAMTLSDRIDSVADYKAVCQGLNPNPAGGC